MRSALGVHVPLLFLVVPLQMIQTCSHSVNRLSMRQLMRNPLRAIFSVLQVIIDNGMANANLNANLFLCDSSVFPDQTINPHNHIRCNEWLDGSVPGTNCLAVMRVLRGISSATSAHLSGTHNVRHTQVDMRQ